MPVPKFHELTLPILQLLADGQTRHVREIHDALAHKLGLSDEDLAIILPSGTQTRFYNRTTWAITYLQKSGLLDKPQRAHVAITERGRSVLASSPPVIDLKFLEQFEEYREFKAKRNTDDTPRSSGTETTEDTTPDEQLDDAYQSLRNALADDLLAKVRASTPAFFEQLVVDLLRAMGYGGARQDAAQVVGKSGDGGIDGVIHEDRLGLDTVYIQAKRWENTVGPDEIRKFVGSLGERRAHKGVFITSGSYTRGALEAADRAHTRIVLIDGDRLAQLMIDFNVGVTPHKTYTIKRIDGDYFEPA